MGGTVWVALTPDLPCAPLLGAARRIGPSVAVAVIGPEELAGEAAALADRVDWFATGAGLPAQALACAVGAHLVGESAELVVTAPAAASRAVIGAVAAALGAPLVAPVQHLEVLDDGTDLTRLVHGGIARESLRAAGPVCAVLDGLDAGARPSGHAPVAVHAVEASALGLRCSEVGAGGAPGPDLTKAERVIGVGRGLRDPGLLSQVRRLAEGIGAELACSRPVAEDLGWLPTDRYLGVSGLRIAPRLYLMLGISGELQHMIGVRDADLIVAVNTDPRAPAMTGCDLGVVADLREFVPALIDELGLSEEKT